MVVRNLKKGKISKRGKSQKGENLKKGENIVTEKIIDCTCAMKAIISVRKF